MTDEAIIERSFTVDGHELVCRFFQPEHDDGSYFCRYVIDWPKKPRERRIGGCDSIQALLLAMQAAHTDLLMAREDEGKSIVWLGSASLGLPLPKVLRDLDPKGSF
jgi:hypothetical protein